MSRFVVAASIALTAVLAFGAPSAQASTPSPGVSQIGSVTVIAEINGPAGTIRIPGANFTLTPVTGIDPATAAGQALLKKYQANPALASGYLDTTATRTLPPTDSNGLTSASGLAEGVYLLHENGILIRHSSPPAVEKENDLVFAIPTQSGNITAYNLQVTPKPAVITPSPLPTPTPSPTPGVRPTPGSLSTPSAPVPSLSSAATHALQTAQIDAGEGAQFNGRDQLALIGLGVALLITVWLATRRRKNKAQS